MCGQGWVFTIEQNGCSPSAEYAASKKQLDNWEILGDGEGIHWPDLDEDLSVSGLLEGNPPEK